MVYKLFEMHKIFSIVTKDSITAEYFIKIIYCEDKGTTEDEMVGWHHQLDGHEFEQTL